MLTEQEADRFPVTLFSLLQGTQTKLPILVWLCVDGALRFEFYERGSKVPGLLLDRARAQDVQGLSDLLEDTIREVTPRQLFFLSFSAWLLSIGLKLQAPIEVVKEAWAALRSADESQGERVLCTHNYGDRPGIPRLVVKKAGPELAARFRAEAKLSPNRGIDAFDLTRAIERMPYEWRLFRATGKPIRFTKAARLK